MGPRPVSVVKEYYEETTKLLAFLKKASASQERDQRIEYIQIALDKRQKLIEQMKPPYSEEEEKIGKQCIDIEKEIQGLLQSEKVLIQKDIVSFSKRKQTRERYVNPYKSLNYDGMFYDKRK